MKECIAHTSVKMVSVSAALRMTMGSLSDNTWNSEKYDYDYDAYAYTATNKTKHISDYNDGQYTFGSAHGIKGSHGDRLLVNLLGERSDIETMHLVEKIENGVYSIEKKTVDDYGWEYMFKNGVGHRVTARVFFDDLTNVHLSASVQCDGEPVIYLSLSRPMENKILEDIFDFLPELDIALIREVLHRSGFSNSSPTMAVERMIAFGSYRTRLLMDILKHSDERIKIIVERLSIDCRLDRCEKCGRCKGELRTIAEDAHVLSKHAPDGVNVEPWNKTFHLPIDVMEYAACDMFRFINKKFQKFNVGLIPYLPDLGNKDEVYFRNTNRRKGEPLGDDAHGVMAVYDIDENVDHEEDYELTSYDVHQSGSYTREMLANILSTSDSEIYVSDTMSTHYYNTNYLALIGLAFDPRGPQRLSERKFNCYEAMTYLKESEKIYAKLKGNGYPVKSCIKEKCKTWKHALSICDNNHSIFNNVDWECFPGMSPMECNIKLPRWMERLRIKSKEGMVAIGDMMHNCLKLHTDSKNLFFKWHTCALELAYGRTPHVIQCFDKFNHTTDDSDKMKRVFTKYVKRHIHEFLTGDAKNIDRETRNGLAYVNNVRLEGGDEMFAINPRYRHVDYDFKPATKIKAEEASQTKEKSPVKKYPINIYLVQNKISLRTIFAA